MVMPKTGRTVVDFRCWSQSRNKTGPLNNANENKRMSVERYQNQLDSFRVHFQQLWTLWSSKTPRQTKSQNAMGILSDRYLSVLSACPSMQSGCTKTPGWSGGSPGNRSTNCQLPLVCLLSMSCWFVVCITWRNTRRGLPNQFSWLHVHEQNVVKPPTRTTQVAVAYSRGSEGSD